MTKRKMTDGERIAARLYGLEADDQEPKWLSAQIDRLLRKRMSEAWEEGWFDRDCQEADWNENPYRPYRKRKK